VGVEGHETTPPPSAIEISNKKGKPKKKKNRRERDSRLRRFGTVSSGEERKMDFNSTEKVYYDSWSGKADKKKKRTKESTQSDCKPLCRPPRVVGEKSM